MAEAERLVKFRLLGQDFAFYTGASEEEMEAILSLVRQQVEDTDGETGGVVPVGKIAVTACLNLASRYLRLKREHEVYREETRRRLRRLNEKLDMHLGREKEGLESF